jgi:hypothetical protein
MPSIKARLEALERVQRRQRPRGPPPIYHVRRSELEGWRAAHPAPPGWRPGDPPFRVILVRSDTR